MGWTETARREHDRSRLRYASDCTDEEWAVIRPLLRPTSRVGRPRKHKARTLWDAIQYIASTGCQWAQLPKDFPPFTTVQYHFYRMRDNSLLDVINAVLVAWVRVSEGRTPAPTAGIINSQSVKTTEAGGPRGYDAGKKIKGRKRHIVTDTLGNMLEGVVHGADVQDRDGAPGLIERSCDAYPTLARVFADGGYAGQKLEAAVAHVGRLTIEIIRRSDLAGFVVLPRRWVVERTLAWLSRCRRLAKDWEASIASSEAWMVVSSIRRMTRRIAKLELWVGLLEDRGGVVFLHPLANQGRSLGADLAQLCAVLRPDHTATAFSSYGFFGSWRSSRGSPGAQKHAIHAPVAL